MARYTSQKMKKKHREALGIIEDSGEELFEVNDVEQDSMPHLDDILNARTTSSNKYYPAPRAKSINAEGMMLELVSISWVKLTCCFRRTYAARIQ